MSEEKEKKFKEIIINYLLSQIQKEEKKKNDKKVQDKM